jgi:hypothetical protein
MTTGALPLPSASSRRARSSPHSSPSTRSGRPPAEARGQAPQLQRMCRQFRGRALLAAQGDLAQRRRMTGCHPPQAPRPMPPVQNPRTGREWLVRRAGARGVSRPRWSQNRSLVALRVVLVARPGGQQPHPGAQLADLQAPRLFAAIGGWIDASGCRLAVHMLVKHGLVLIAVPGDISGHAQAAQAHEGLGERGIRVVLIAYPGFEAL